jgi:hypothetical protein
MSLKNKKQIIYAFIDSQNLNLGTSKNIYKKGRLFIKDGGSILKSLGNI